MLQNIITKLETGKAKYFIYSLVLAIYVYFTLTNANMLGFNIDEIHAWNISANLSWWEIIKCMPAEGHTFVWYYILKPFTYFPDIFYPWVMKIINYIFIIGAVLLVLFRAPINLCYKILIIFSYPVFSFFPYLSRHYGIGIFLILLIASLYKNRFNHPVLFSILLFFCANTSFLALITILPIGLFFLYDMFKDRKKEYTIPIIILFLVPVVLFIQWHGYYTPEYNFNRFSNNLFGLTDNGFNSFKIVPTPYVPLVLFIEGIIACIFYFKNNVRFIISLALTGAIFITFTMCIYNLSYYHYLFIPIAFVLVYWIFEESGTKPKNKDIIKGFNIWLVFCLVAYLPVFKTEVKEFFYPRKLKTTILNCVYDTIPEGSVLYTKMYLTRSYIPDLKKKYILRDIYGGDLLSLEHFYELYHSLYKFYRVDLDIHKKMDREYKHHYIFASNEFVDRSDIRDMYKGQPIRCDNLYIYKLD